MVLKRQSCMYNLGCRSMSGIRVGRARVAAPPDGTRAQFAYDRNAMKKLALSIAACITAGGHANDRSTIGLGDSASSAADRRHDVRR
ncbi:hypothetical protein WI41_12180 [Burkholderia latens]|uniref:Uncharacterized protein n=1 Tax=Burkholderia latens TaxID=488446 RepID=A0AAP1GB45_9BURK|nr:hypothetical protein WI41_12180 [Burkholderia latens]